MNSQKKSHNTEGAVGFEVKNYFGLETSNV